MGKQSRIKRTVKNDNIKQQPPHKTTDACGTAITAYEEENYNGALEAIKNRESDYRNNVFYLHAEAFLHYKLATKNKDAMTVRKHLQDAATSAYQSWTLFGNSILLAHFCVSMLYILAGFNRDYERVIQECQRALEMINPKDPQKDNFIFKDLSQEMNIKKMTQELRAMMQQSEKKTSWIGVNPGQRFQENIKAIEDRVDGNNISSLRKELEERRKKHASKNFMDNFAKIQKIIPFWVEKMCDETKKNLFKVKVEDLRSHLDSLTDCKLTDLMLEGIEFAKKWQTWKFWEGCHCCKKFADWKSYKDHLYFNHLWHMNHCKEWFPHEVDNVSVEIITKGEWKPVDIDDRIKIIVQRLLFGSDSYKNISSIASMGDLEGLLSGDSDLPELLEKVHGMFQLLLEYKCLMQYHVDAVINNSFEMLRKRVSDLKMNPDLKNLKIVCFLEYPELERILDYLQVQFNTFGLSGNPKGGNSLDEPLSNDLGFDIKEKVLLTDDFSYLLLDEQLLVEESNLNVDFDPVVSDGSAVRSANTVQGDGVLLVSKKMLPLLWLYAGQELKKELESWKSTRQSQQRQAKELLSFFEEERSHLGKTCEEKWERIQKHKAVKAVQSLCGNRKERGPKNVRQTYSSLLRERKEELEERNVNPVNYNQYELDFLLNILEIDQTMNAYQIENLSPSDNCLQKNVRGWNLHLLRDLQVDNATIMQSVSVMKQYSMILGHVSACDYLSIMLPILKSFIQSRLEDLVLKENKDHSDANLHVLLKEFDAKKKINEECNNMRQEHRQSRIKKKKEKNKGKKDDAQIKDFKGTEHGKKPWLPQEEAEQNSPVPCSSGYPVLYTIVSTTADEQQEKEVLDKISGHQMQSLISDTTHGSNSLGPGLENKDGDNNCFLNVIIQSLRHLRTFHDKFMSRTKHGCVGDHCVVCALRDVFDALREACMSNKKSVSPLPLRKALSHLHANEANNIKNFKMGQENDALEAWEAILEHLQKSSYCCLVDEIFGMKIKIQISRVPILIHQWSISHILKISAEELRDLKSTYGSRSFNELVKIKLEEIASDVYDWLPPDVILIGCHILKRQEISEVLNSLSTTLTISIDSQGLDSWNKYILFSMVCFCPQGKHFTCIIRNHERERFVWYNDEKVEDIGRWDDVFRMCIKRHMQPHTLLFKTKNLEEPSDKDTTQKSDAEIENLSAEHSPDSKNKINEVSDNMVQKEDEKKTEEKRAEESKATGDSENFQQHQNDAEDKNPNSEICEEKKLLEENSVYQRQNKNEAEGKCNEKRNEKLFRVLERMKKLYA